MRSVRRKLVGTRALFDVHQRGQRHKVAVLVGAHVEIVEVADRRALLVARLQDDVVFLARAFKRGDDARAHHGLERTAHGLQRHAEIGGLVAVDLHDHAGLALQIVRLEIEDAGVFRRRRDP